MRRGSSGQGVHTATVGEPVTHFRERFRCSRAEGAWKVGHSAACRSPGPCARLNPDIQAQHPAGSPAWAVLQVLWR